MSFFLQKVLVLRRWLARVDEKMLFATSLLPITTEEYSRSRCRYWGFINIIIPQAIRKARTGARQSPFNHQGLEGYGRELCGEQGVEAETRWGKSLRAICPYFVYIIWMNR